MAITLSATGITYSDSTSETTASRQPNVPTVVDIQTFTGGQTTATNGTGTWTKPTGGQTTAQIEIWGGGAGSSGTAGCAGGYTIFRVPITQLPSTFTCNAPSNAASLGGGAGQTASVTGVTGSGWLATTAANFFTATGGTTGAGGTGRLHTITTNTGGGGGGASALGIWGGAAAAAGSNGNNPGGGATTTTHYGGCAQVRITCW
jgi:hypothetical protein